MVPNALTDGRVHASRLRIGMGVVALLHPLFWLGRRGVDPTEAEVAGMRLAIVSRALALVSFSYTSVVRRFGQHVIILGFSLLLVASSWIVVAQGWGTQYVIAPVILFFVIGAIAANGIEAGVIVAVAAVAPLVFTLLHGWEPHHLPGIPLLLLASAAIGGTMISWFRSRSQVLLRQEIERREQVEADLRGARAHLESILNATSDGILDVQFTADGPRISFANRRFGEIFGLAPESVVGLGLSICRELVTLMGGQIALTSAGLERGTEVRFTLPTPAPPRVDRESLTNSTRSQ